MSDDDERALIDERMAEPVAVTWGQLRADIAAQDAADAERFRWLVSNYPDAVAMIPEVMLRRPHDEVEAIARAAIDAAMKEDGE